MIDTPTARSGWDSWLYVEMIVNSSSYSLLNYFCSRVDRVSIYRWHFFLEYDIVVSIRINRSSVLRTDGSRELQALEGTRLIHCHNKLERGEMNMNNNQSQQNLHPIQSRARLLVSQNRQQQRNRQLSMLQRAAQAIETQF